MKSGVPQKASLMTNVEPVLDPTSPLRFTLPLKFAVNPLASLAVSVAGKGTFVVCVGPIGLQVKLATAPDITANALLTPVTPPDVRLSLAAASTALIVTLP